MASFFLAQWIIKRFQITESSLYLKEYFIVLLLKYSSIRDKKYYIVLLWTEGALFCSRSGTIWLLGHYLANNTNKWNAVLFLFMILSLSNSRFETRTRILFSKSQSSRREREFCSLNLRVRDENEIFVLLISEFETRTRFFSEHLRVRDESEIFSFKVLRSSEKKWI